MFCREWLAQLELHNDLFAATGLKVVAIAQGRPVHAARYCGRLAPSITCYTDPTAEVYDAYAIGRSVLTQILNPGVYLAGVRATLRGHRQGKPRDDVRRLPGTFIVDTAGIVRHAHYSAHSGDYPDIKRLLARVTINIQQSTINEEQSS